MNLQPNFQNTVQYFFQIMKNRNGFYTVIWRKKLKLKIFFCSFYVDPILMCCKVDNAVILGEGVNDFVSTELKSCL